MQTERVTFLTSPDHKAALDAYARETGRSVGHVLREASSTYMAKPQSQAEDEVALELLAEELERLVPEWNERFDRMEANLDRAHNAVRKALEQADAALR